MLVLTRKLGEELVARLPDGRQIVISVVGLCGSRVRIGIDSPGDIEVDRREVRINKDLERRSAA